jgi:hypothetical protein
MALYLLLELPVIPMRCLLLLLVPHLNTIGMLTRCYDYACQADLVVLMHVCINQSINQSINQPAH